MVEPASGLTFRAACVDYGSVRVVHEVSLEVGGGELVALAGPNGSGKSTLLRAGLGLLPLSAGQALLHGRTVQSLSIRERARAAAWMPQDEPLGDNVSLWEFVEYGRNPHRDWMHPVLPSEREVVGAALDAVGLVEFADRPFWALSGGERQRGRLARALAQGTKLLALDEPTAHLDIGHQLSLLDLARTVAHRDGRAVVVAIHDLNLAARYADRVIVLSRGRLVAQGPPSAVLSTRILREVWGVIAELRTDSRSGVPYLVPSLPVDNDPGPTPVVELARVHVVGGGGSTAGLLRALSDAGYEVTLGVVPLFDSDSEVAQELHIPAVVEVPFAPISEAVRAQHRRLLDEANAVIVGPFPVGSGNLSNLEDVRAFVDPHSIILVEPPDLGSRDFTGGKVEPILAELRAQGGKSVPDVPNAMTAVGEILSRPRTLPATEPPA